MNLLVDIDKTIQPREYRLILCKPNMEPIQEIYDFTDDNYITNFTGVDELSFSIPRFLNDNSDPKGKSENRIYNLVNGHFLIKLIQENEDDKVFIIDDIENEQDDVGYAYKRLTCYSREYELANKQIVGYDLPSRLLYDPSNEKDENDEYWGFMNYIQTLSSWQVDYYKSVFEDRFREISIARQNVLNSFRDIQQTYGALFQYDTVNKKINIYEVDDIGVDRGLYISDENFIQSMIQNMDFSEVKTRLYVYGKDDVSIQTLNPTGLPYIDNYNFFKDAKDENGFPLYMTQDLIDAIDAYEDVVATKEGEFQLLLDELDGLQDELSDLLIDLFDLETEYIIVLDNIDTLIQAGDWNSSHPNYSSLISERNSLETDIENKQSEIETIRDEIDEVYDEIIELNAIIKAENNFTQEQYFELDNYIKEEVFRDSGYTEQNIQELYDKGKEKLAQVSQPPISFDISVVNFLDIVECQHVWDKLVLGDLVTISHEALGIHAQVRLVGYEYSKFNNELLLSFSNRDFLDNPNLYLRDLLDHSTNVSTQVDFSKFKWEKYYDEERNSILNFINSELDAARNRVIAGRNQNVEINDRGITCKSDTDPDKQIRIMNDIIAMTDDGWDSARTAISADGIVAEHIAGILGEFVKLRANQIIALPEGDQSLEEFADASAAIDEHNNSPTPHTLPSYATMESDGFKVYDDQNVKRVHMGQYEPGQYGIHIENGELFSSYVKTSSPGDNTYIELTPNSELNIYKDGNHIMRMDAGSNEARLNMADANDEDVFDSLNILGRFGMADGNYGAITTGSQRKGFVIRGDHGGELVVNDNGVTVRGGFAVASGSKNAIVETESYGNRLMYSMEMPESRFDDCGIGALQNGVYNILLDPIFLETIEKNSQSPYVVNVTPYGDFDLYVESVHDSYITVKSKSADKGQFAWRVSAIRKGYKEIRMEERK